MSCKADRIMLQMFGARLEGSMRYILGRRGRQRVYVRERRSVREGYRGALTAEGNDAYRRIGDALPVGHAAKYSGEGLAASGAFSMHLSSAIRL